MADMGFDCTLAVVGCAPRRSTMNSFTVGGALAAALALGLGTVTAIGQSSNGAVETHVAAAKKAAGQEWAGVFNTTCNAAVPPATAPARGAAPAAPRPPGPPERS